MPVGTDVVDRLVEAFAGELGPQAVDEGLGEIGVVLGGDPFGQAAAAVGVVRADGQLVARGEQDRLHERAFGLRVLGVGHAVLGRAEPRMAMGPRKSGRGCGIGRHDRDLGQRSLADTGTAGLAGDAREERGELMELLARPAVGRMVVALGALNLHAKENAAHFADDLFGLALLSDDQAAGAVFVGAATGGDEFGGDLAPGLVVVKRSAR